MRPLKIFFKFRYGATLLALISILFLNHDALAVPHINGRPEPLKAGVGKHIAARLNKTGTAPRALALAPAAYPASIRVILLRIEFAPDTDPLTTGTGTWSDPAYAVYPSDPLYAGNPSDYWVQKAQTRINSYYNEVSYGNLSITADISPTVYTLSHQASYYSTAGAQGFENIIKDSVAASTAAVNYALYDSVFIVHAGPGAETDIAGDSSHDFWSSYYYSSCIDADPLTPGCQQLTAGGKAINEAIVVPQNACQDGWTVDSLGILVHEFGHWLGLPDLYNTSLFALTQGVGKWSLMGDGSYLGSPFGSSPAHLDAWSKTYLGWLTPTVITSTSPDPGQKMLVPVESNPSALRITISATDPSEYYILENRQLTLFDSYLPGHGMLVWHINDAVINANMASNTINTSPSTPGVKLIEADGDFALMKLNAGVGSSGDPYPGSTSNTELTPSSVPPSTPYLGGAYANLKSIVENGSNVSFILGYGPDATSSVSGTFVCPATATLNWTAASAPDMSAYKIYKNNALLAQTQATTYTDSTAVNGDVYTISSVDAAGNEGAKSASYTAQNCTLKTSSTNKDKSTNCFVATAAYGSFESPYVLTLREFRDKFLLTNYFGRAFVDAYYSLSPPLADVIRSSAALRFIVRTGLVPLIIAALFINAAGASAAPILTMTIMILIFRKKLRRAMGNRF